MRFGCFFFGAPVATALFACTSTSTEPPSSVAPDGSVDAASEPPEPIDAGRQDAVAGECTLPGDYGSDECNTCIAARCCDEITACDADPACKDLQKCALDCQSTPDPGACLEQCFVTYPSGRELWDQADRCSYGPPPEGCLVDCTN